MLKLALAIVLTATQYHAKYIGRPMAGGGKYDPQAMTVAMNHIKLGTKVIVCRELPVARPSEDARDCVRVTVTDRIGIEGRIDFSKAGYHALGFDKCKGCGKLRGGLPRVKVYKDEN